MRMLLIFALIAVALSAAMALYHYWNVGYSIDSKLQPYVNSFYSEAAVRGKPEIRKQLIDDLFTQ